MFFTNDEFTKLFVGFEPMIKRISEVTDQATKLASKFPFYNIKKLEENRFLIELAVAGFSKQELDVELVDGKLVIKGNSDVTDDGSDYLYHGLAKRPFTREFQLADNIEITSGELVNGVLKIWLTSLTPESKKVKIDISEKGA